MLFGRVSSVVRLLEEKSRYTLQGTKRGQACPRGKARMGKEGADLVWLVLSHYDQVETASRG